VKVNELIQCLTATPAGEIASLAGALGYTLKAEYNMKASSSSAS